MLMDSSTAVDLHAAGPLITHIRRALAAARPAAGPDAAASLFNAAPAEDCARLADLWAAAGPAAARFRDRLPPDDQVVLDMVVATYPPDSAAASEYDIDLDTLLADAAGE